MLDPTRKYSKYLSFKGLSRSQKFEWQDTQEAIIDDYNGLSQGSTLLKLRHTNIPEGTTMGYIKATWYIAMRGQRGLGA